MSTTRERIEKAADRAGFTVAPRGIFDELTKGSTRIVIMYTGNGAVSGADLYIGDATIPVERISATESGKATKVINWMA
jgi:hypothetical protein